MSLCLCGIFKGLPLARTTGPSEQEPPAVKPVQPLVDPASRRRRNEMLKAVRAALQQNDEWHFLEAIRRHLGLKDGSPEFLKAWQAWRDYHGKS